MGLGFWGSRSRVFIGRYRCVHFDRAAFRRRWEGGKCLGDVVCVSLFLVTFLSSIGGMGKRRFSILA